MQVINMFVNVASAILSVPRYALQPFGPPMMEPPPQSTDEAQRRHVVDRLLDLGYHDDTNNNDDNDETTSSTGYDVFSLPQAEEATFAQFTSSATAAALGGGPSPSTYGEVTTLGARQLFYFMGMTKTTACRGSDNNNNNDHKDDALVFYDLGMGRGKLVVQALLELDHVGKSIGVELSHMRHQAALMAWQTLLNQHAALHASSSHRLGLHRGDLFQQDLMDATHIYVASLCFTDTMMTDLQVKLTGLPNLQCVASLKKFPSWKHSRTEYVEMTWTRPHGCLTYFYDL